MTGPKSHSVSQDWNPGVSEFPNLAPPGSDQLPVLKPWLISRGAVLSISPVRRAPQFPSQMSLGGRISPPFVTTAALDAEGCVGEMALPSCSPPAHPGPSSPAKGRHPLTRTNLQSSQVRMRFLMGPAASWLQAGLGVKRTHKRQERGKKRAVCWS